MTPLRFTWLGHAAWLIQRGPVSFVIDPFNLNLLPGPLNLDNLPADYILVTHGHEDHVADVEPLAARRDSTIVANFEICEWFRKRGLRKFEPMNLGGGIDLPDCRVEMTVAWHSSTMPDGSSGGNPGGFVLVFPEANIYVAGDTAFFSDMQQIGTASYRFKEQTRTGLSVAILPIGDRYTMGPPASVRATSALSPAFVLPSHYNTWPPIAQNAAAWAENVRRGTTAQPVVLEVGQSWEFP